MRCFEDGDENFDLLKNMAGSSSPFNVESSVPSTTLSVLVLTSPSPFSILSSAMSGIAVALVSRVSIRSATRIGISSTDFVEQSREVKQSTTSSFLSSCTRSTSIVFGIFSITSSFISFGKLLFSMHTMAIRSNVFPI